MSICSMEEVSEAVDKPFWFQLYLMRDRDIALDLIERASALNISTLVVTVDLPVLGMRYIYKL